MAPLWLMQTLAVLLILATTIQVAVSIYFTKLNKYVFILSLVVMMLASAVAAQVLVIPKSNYIYKPTPFKLK